MNERLRHAERKMLAELGARYRLWAETAEPTVLARGTENTTFAIGGWIVRHSAQRETQEREVALLRDLRETVAVPLPDPRFHDPESGLFAYPRLPGTPLLRSRNRGSRSVESGLVEVLRALHESSAARRLPRDPYPNERWLRDATVGFQEIRSHLTAPQARLVHAFVEDQPPSTRSLSVPQHNDLGAEHILVGADGGLSGIIDWSDAACADPARDTGSLYRDLGPETAFRISEALGRPVTADEAARIGFHARCRWIEDVAFGLRAPRARLPYLANADLTFARTFGRQ